MTRKAMTLAAAVTVGLLLTALPAVAAAASPDMDFSKANPPFAASSGEFRFTLGSALMVNCMSSSAVGQWSTEGLMNTGSTGTVQMTLKNCLAPGGTSCTTPGFAKGEIRSEELVFHLVYIKGFTRTTGLLFTNNATTERFAVTSCGNITGNGLIAHLGGPECGGQSKDLTAAFETVSAGVPRYQEIEGSATKYHWLYGTNEAGADLTWTMSLGEVTATLTCP